MERSKEANNFQKRKEVRSSRKKSGNVRAICSLWLASTRPGSRSHPTLPRNTEQKRMQSHPGLRIETDQANNGSIHKRRCLSPTCNPNASNQSKHRIIKSRLQTLVHMSPEEMWFNKRTIPPRVQPLGTIYPNPEGPGTEETCARKLEIRKTQGHFCSCLRPSSPYKSLRSFSNILL